MNMEISAAVQHTPPFWCNICKIRCSSAVDLEKHILGAKHKEVTP
ncbi:hypothetical protein FKM82_006576 [Ascaphus truei]